MARSLDQILSELNSVYNPQISSVRKRQSMIPGQIKSEEAGLQAKQGQAFNDILGGARQRGLGFSGIPLAEQAKYTSTEFLPAMARLRQTGREQAMGLEDAILGIQERRGTMAQQIRQQELDRDFAREQARRASAQQTSLAGLFNQPQKRQQTLRTNSPDPDELRFYGHVRDLVDQVQSGNGVQFSQILRMARNGSASAKQTARAFYELSNIPIPANFRSFL